MRTLALVAAILALEIVPPASGLQEPVAEHARPADVYVVPFSHLDLYWAGTQEECLSRGNRIITQAMQFALRYPQSGS